MIIPIRCFTCGKVLAHLWEPYIEKLQEGTSKEMLEKGSKTRIGDVQKYNGILSNIS